MRSRPPAPAAPAWRDRRRRRGAAEPRAIGRTSPQHLVAHLFGRLEVEAGKPSRLPSTRSTFQPGRVSPSGWTTPLKLCARPSQLTNVPEFP